MPSIDIRATIQDRLAAVEERIAAACAKSGRSRASITLVAVTKMIDTTTAALLPELGVFDLGENRPQELWRKADALPKSIRWHMIGTFQRNKVARTLPLIERVHAVDSERLLRTLDEEAAKLGRIVPVFLEVNASREPSKHGFAPETLAPLGGLVAGLKSLRIAGLMTMAAYADDPEDCRATFAEVRLLRDRLEREWGHALPDLSMGMSNDYMVAIEEGATFIRLGTTLFADPAAAQ